MATTAAIFEPAKTGAASSSDTLRAGLSLLVCAGLPMGLFGLVHLGAETLGLLPLYFTPFGLPAWTGPALHLLQLSLVGAATWAIPRVPARSSAITWLIALAGTLMVLPFATPMLDSLMLAMVCATLFLLAAATTLRVGKLTPVAAWLLAPVLLILGFSAALGLAVAAYAPPFALMQSHQSPPAA